ncbi:MAG: hypothetical protein GY746_04830 [Gammaproteobacteria bacterium]|nr:hypothetical protein [Gammaproteobacteria bacterium]MCP4276876.1 hypothetical protein [Gammaproteobacteria bacterium]MCP4830719.1 hypothetical protein [Gammaproteobacteria bacterium]MCP4928857.1 hypothetical protein [Gammaproteobacteria bacterium]
MRNLKIILLLMSIFVLAANVNANEKLDCLDSLLDLGYATKGDLAFMPMDGATELQLRKGLAIRAWVGYWVYDAGMYDKAQFAMSSYNDLMNSYQTSGFINLGAGGQPDLVALHGVADTCVNSPPAELATGLQTIQSGADEREFWLQLPSDYGVGDPKPLVFAYHGYTGSYQNWVGPTRAYDFIDEVGDDAIFVAPNALPNAAGQRVWGGVDDYAFFLDMIAELQLLGLVYNSNRVFVAGHSNGAGFTHDLGCEYGDVIRGIATAAGALTNNNCTGSLAALMMQGSNDPLTNSNLALGALRYWVLYNGWAENTFGAATVGLCDDYANITPAKPLNQPYPVLWCEHTQGHSWPDYASQTVWDFFTGLSDQALTTDAPPGGGNAVAELPKDSDMTFQVQVPATINRPLNAVPTLRSASYYDSPTCSAPPIVLSQAFSVDGLMVPGEVSSASTIPITYFSFTGPIDFTIPWTLSIAVYVEGGSTSVIPTPFIDHELKVLLLPAGYDPDNPPGGYVPPTGAQTAIMPPDKNTDLFVMPAVPFPLEPIPDLCGFGAP